MPVCYQPNDRQRARPQPLPRSECGLPEDALVLCGFNQPFKISAEVFGDQRHRGRVERILRRGPIELLLLEAEANAARLEELHELSPLQLLRTLLESCVLETEQPDGKPPTVVQMQRIFTLYQRLETAEQLERLNALTRRQR